MRKLIYSFVAGGVFLIVSTGAVFASTVGGNVYSNIQVGTGIGATVQTSQNSTGSIVGLQAQVQAGTIATSSANSVIELQGNTANLIQADADLTAYDNLVMQARPAVTAINTNSDGSIDIGYSQPAKFLGIFPTSLSGDINIDAQGNATIRLPWWSFLYSKDTTGIQTTAATAAQTSGANFDDQAGTTTALQDQARVINAVSAAVQEEASTSANVNAAASATSTGY
jgi:hypothetical protein